MSSILSVATDKIWAKFGCKVRRVGALDGSEGGVDLEHLADLVDAFDSVGAPPVLDAAKSVVIQAAVQSGVRTLSVAIDKSQIGSETVQIKQTLT